MSKYMHDTAASRSTKCLMSMGLLESKIDQRTQQLLVSKKA